MKTGVSTSIIVKTRDEKHYAIMKKKDTEKKNRAKICISCDNNSDGFCSKHKEWCVKTNWICLGIKNPYEYKMPPSKKKKISKKK